MESTNNYMETDLGNVSPNPKGTYDNATAYEYLDLVEYQGGSYLCTVDIDKKVKGISPTVGQNSETWQLVALPGTSTEEYVAKHTEVIEKAKQVETSRAAVELCKQEVESAQADVEQMRQDTQQAAQNASDANTEAQQAAQQAEASRSAAQTNEQNAAASRDLANTYKEAAETAKSAAETAAQNASESKTAAETAAQNATQSKADIDSIKAGIEEAAKGENVSQIQQNMNDISQLKESFVNDYEIKKRETSLTLYEGYLPECYQTYFVTRKIEGLSLKTLNLYDLYLKDFFLVMNKDIKKITTNDIRVYLYKVQQQRKLSNRTLDSRRSAIHAFLEWATNEEYIDRNPCRNIKRIKYERKKKKPLTPLEMEQLRNACETVRDKALVEFFYSTGCRVTECERMNLDDVDFLKKEVHLFGKGDKHRTSFLNAKAELVLKNYLETRNLDDPALFVGERKPYNRLKKAAIEKRFRQLGEKAGIKRRVHPHLIRHTSATDARDHGMPIEEVKEFLGHSSIATTLEYADVTEATTKCSHKRCVI